MERFQVLVDLLVLEEELEQQLDLVAKSLVEVIHNGCFL
jgi:hypothetical protein